MGSIEQPMLNGTEKTRKSIKIKNLPIGITKEDAHTLVRPYGHFTSFHLGTPESKPFIELTYENPDDAKIAYESLSKQLYQGLALQVELTNTKSQFRKNFKSQINNMSQSKLSVVPLRILVPCEYVGAIIGKKGQSIRNITTKCKARIDVHGKENIGNPEKIISIYGQPENCSQACKEILKVLEQEMITGLRGELLLKMLANDQYCGRLIGKEGRIIKKIREETGTKIIVTNVQEMMGLYPDRVISIKGNVESVISAESALSTKLIKCIENDAAKMALNAPYLSSGTKINSYYKGQALLPLQYESGFKNPGLSHDNYTGFSHPQFNGLSYAKFTTEICHIIIPNSAVGSIIGSAGSVIKQMMKNSSAFISVENKPDSEITASTERIITIKGTADACWRACYFIFEKMRLEGFSGNDNVLLKTKIFIPRITVGRVIGKSGKTVREIQHFTGALIKLPNISNNQKHTKINTEKEINVANSAGDNNNNTIIYPGNENIKNVEVDQSGDKVNDQTNGEVFADKQEKSKTSLNKGKRTQRSRSTRHRSQLLSNGEVSDNDKGLLQLDVPVEVFGNFMSVQSAFSRIRAIVDMIIPMYQQKMSKSNLQNVGHVKAVRHHSGPVYSGSGLSGNNYKPVPQLLPNLPLMANSRFY